MKTNKEKFDVIVIGGGASGMMAAGRAGERGKRVLLLEKNRALGKKLKITGGGRCNITNAEYDNHKLLENYGDAAKFLHSAFSKFSVKDTFEFFESRNLPLVVEARLRAFPKSQKAEDVFNIMELYVKKSGVSIKTNAKVKRINIEKNIIKSVLVGTTEYFADNFVIATGGVSYPSTGSTGDGFRWLKGLGHTIYEPNPNIVPLKVKERWVKQLAGVTLSFMKITFYLDGKREFSKTGKILFTHFGLSGPLILNSAAKVKMLLNKGEVTATIDSYPDTNLGLLEKKILKIFDTNKNRDFKNIVDVIAPVGMGKSVLALAGIEGITKVHSITKDERKKLIRLLKAFPITIDSLMGFDRAVVSDGGVSLKEVDTKEMKSKLFKNLYFTGDLLNINRPSGGFSLQLCWTTGFVVGDSI